jgi:hypothetical protein
MGQTFNGVKYTFFWGGIFSNWYPSNFEVDAINYNCGEQYMMYQKATTFGDDESAKLILSEKSPRNQKALGRKVKNFDVSIWDSVKYDLVKTGLREKFKQNQDMKEYLLKYCGYQIVEASHEDRIWGIGYAEDDAIVNIDNWGENLLGKILTELSEELK